MPLKPPVAPGNQWRTMGAGLDGEELSERLRRSEQLATAGLMVASIVHEINNIATLLAGNAQNLGAFWERLTPTLERARHRGTAEEQSMVQFILSEMPQTLASMALGVERIGELAGSLRNLDNGAKDQPGPCDVNECVRRAVELARPYAGREVELHLDLSAREARILAAAGHVEQAVLNLVINAVDAIRDQAGTGHVWLHTQSGDGDVKLTVADDGPGIDPAMFESIWQPFFTTKPGHRGTGLGLAIVQSTVQAQGGNVEAGNAPGGGACFALTWTSAAGVPRPA